jgi:hypothetical protein
VTAPGPGAALREYRGYRYTIVTIANGAQPHTSEAELWYAALDGETVGRWYYFRRYVSAQAGQAARRVEADFTQWLDGRLEAADSVE